MTLDPARLLAYKLRPVHQTLTKRDAILYALSVGLGQDPLDPDQLDFVDQHRGLKAMPSMAVVLGYPGFWLADKATTVDALRVVHGEQGLVLHRPLPVEGEVVGATRITGLVDKGAGKGALLYTEKRVTDRATGELLATTTATTVLRGDGGFGGPSGPVRQAHAVPEGAPDLVVDLPTRPEQALLYRLNGDDNPLHANPATAAAAGFPRPILHGLCTFGVVTHALLRGLCEYDPQRLRGIDLRFSAPVFPGETIRTEMFRDGSFRALALERNVIVVNNGRALVA
ncbi:MAG TPA: MaoC/PaaZ C-terminal domain-containing protein [Acetobacteraceae bacterium]|nr:MaoC/PaaZ C-terminal domain-containing protein [Acetobacteraceae bacterium]